MAKFAVDTKVLSNCSQRLSNQVKRINALDSSLIKVANDIKASTSFELARINVIRFDKDLLTISDNFKSLSTALNNIIKEYENRFFWNSSDINALDTDITDAGMLYKDQLEYRISNAVEPAVSQLYQKYIDKIKVAEDLYNDTAHYNPFFNHIKYNAALDGMDPRGAGSVYFHEVGHLIDDRSDWFGNKSTDWSYDFYDSLKSDFDNYVKSKGCASVQDAYDEINNWLWTDGDMKAGVSDIIRGLSGEEIGKWGHEMKYYNKGSIAKEAFANFFEAGMSDTSVKLDYIKEVFPNAYENYMKMINDAL
jgi:hypothetical protein